MKGREPHSDVLSAVETALGQVPRPSPERIRVSFLDPNTVALHGEVRTLAEKEDLGRRASQAAPGCRINNSLTVAVNRPHDDAQLTDQAADILARERVPGIGVEVCEGIAILRGTANSVEDVAHAGRLVGHVPGIREVRTDHVAVAKEQRIDEIVTDLDEAAIVNAIQAKLRQEMAPGHAEEVATHARHRTVFLKGFVRTALEREQAERIARSVPGPARVVNLLVSQDGTAGRDERVEAAIRHRFGKPDDHVTPVDIKVFVEKDEVFLFGQADFPEQVDEAISIVREIVGPVHVHSEVVVTSRHPRPATGPGRAVEEAAGP